MPLTANLRPAKNRALPIHGCKDHLCPLFSALLQSQNAPWHTRRDALFRPQDVLLSSCHGASPPLDHAAGLEIVFFYHTSAKEPLINSAAHLAVPFPPCISCRFFDLPPVNLQNLQERLTENSLAS